MASIGNLVRRSPLEPVMDLWTLLLHLRYLWKHTGPAIAKQLPAADLYYVHAFEFAPAVLWRNRSRGACIIYDAHDLYLELLSQADTSRFARRFMVPINRWLEKRLVQASRAVITTSTPMGRRIGELYECEPIVVRNCHDDRLDEPQDAVAGLRQRVGLSDMEFLVVSVGNAKPAHAVREAIQAIRSCPENVHLAFVGGGYEKFASMVDEADLQDRVHFIGRLHPTEIVPCIEDADLAMLPYVPYSLAYEVFLPNGFFQSISAGLPLMCGQGLRDPVSLCVEMELGWIFNPKKPLEIRKIVEDALNNPSRLAAYRENVKRAASVLCWQQEEIRLKEVAKNAIGMAAAAV